MKQFFKKMITLLLLTSMIIFPLSSCDYKISNSTNYEEFISVDIFCSQANYQGLQSGWFGDMVKEKFNMEINIIAPNVSGGGDTLFQTRYAAGNLGDIVMIDAENGRLEDAVSAGLLLDMSTYDNLMPNALQYTDAISRMQNAIGTDGIYCIPSDVSLYSATDPGESIEPTFGPYLRWDLYTQVGSPQIETLEDLLPVLKSMQDLEPETETGEKTYAFSLFKNWDENMMMMAKQPACLYGYDEVGFALSSADGSSVQSIIDADSFYVRSLHFFYTANQMGLLDPESPTQNWDAVWSKCKNGELLFSFWPWLGQDSYNTADHMAEGKGFMIAPIDDMKILSFGATPTGKNYVVGIGSQAKDPERMAAFIDWLYSPEGIMYTTTETGRTCGPEGLTWEMVDGRPELTEFGIEAMLKGGADLPEEWGGGTWIGGVSQLNFTTVLGKDINPENGYPYDFRMWDSYLEFKSAPLHDSWSEEMNANSTFDYLKKNDQYVVAPGTDYIAPSEPNEINLLRSQCKEIIIDLSWEMVFASSEEEFQSLLSEMQQSVIDLGYEEVLAWDLEIVENLNIAREKARE